MTTAHIINMKDVESAWTLAEHYISRCDSEVSTAKDLLPLLLEGSRTLILVLENDLLMGACIAREINGFARKVLITTLGGDKADWNKAISDFSRQLKHAGYERLEVQGRRGWLRSLNDFEEMHTTIGKEL